MRVKRPVGGAPSVSQVEVRESYQEGFLARVTPITGRRHQIRIHLAAEGHPLWGDVKYGGPAAVQVGGRELGIGRVALHSARLELPTREVFEAPWPADFQSWVEELRKGGTRV
jgi:23S rRNA-/tRNA-specific pseudouridylate synthase